MNSIDLGRLFPGVDTLLASSPGIMVARLGLMFLGGLLIYLGKKGALEPLLMIPMGLGMIAVNGGVMWMAGGKPGTLHLDPLVTEPVQLLDILQIDWLQPIYTLAFSNGLIACLVFMGIGVLLDVGYLLARPFTSMFLALCAEFGTIATLPIAHAFGLSIKDSASIAMVGGADGPMVLFTSLILSKQLFVPITVVAYLYLGLTYGLYPYLIKLLVPRHIRGLNPPRPRVKPVSAGKKLAFAVVTCGLLCFLFPVAAPLFLSLFLGVSVREAGLKDFEAIIGGPVLYGATLFLGLLLGVLCEANLILSPTILPLLLLGSLALLLSGLGGLAGGYVLYFATGKRFNPVIGIAGVSCVPTCAKVAQKCVAEVTPGAVVLPEALGACISGVITSAIIAGVYVTLLQ